MDLLYINGQQLEIESGQDVKIVTQANDIATLDKRQDSYSERFKVPITRHNTSVLQGLSLSGDLSRLPYQKNTCIFIRDGVTLINKGWATITNTGREYTIFCYEGIIDLYKDLENQTIGESLDLSEINHLKNVANVVGSFTNENYRYIIADYNGKTHYQNSINIDYLVPSVRVKYLWEKIQEKFGWQFIGTTFDREDFQNLWMTYPKPTVDEDETRFDVSESGRNQFTKDYIRIGTIPRDEMLNDPAYKNWNSDFVVHEHEAEKEQDNWSIKVLNGGNFKLNFTLAGHVLHSTEYLNAFPGVGEPQTRIETALDQMVVEVYVKGERKDIKATGNSIKYFQSIQDNEVNVSSILTGLSAGDLITFKIRPENGGLDRVTFEKPTITKPSYKGAQLYIKKLDLTIKRLSAGSADFNEALSDFNILDFFREMLWHFGLTLYIDKYDKKAYFLTMEERLTKAKIYDFTRYYLERTNEQYQLTTYARKNRFKHKYNDEQSSYNDGIIRIEDVNLNDEKNVIESRLYTPDKEVTDFVVQSPNTIKSLNIFRIWNKEPNEKDGVIGIKYKGLDKRFYLIRNKVDPAVTGSFISEQLSEGPVTANNVPLADYTGLKYKEITENNYPEVRKILNDTRIHTIEMNLPLPLVSQFNMQGLYYFQQEGMYYIPNRLNYSKSKITGEFVRVKINLERQENDCPFMSGLTYINTASSASTQDYIFRWDKITDNRVTLINLYIKRQGETQYRLFDTMSALRTSYSLIYFELGRHSFRFELIGACENTVEPEDLPGFADIGIEQVSTVLNIDFINQVLTFEYRISYTFSQDITYPIKARYSLDGVNWLVDETFIIHPESTTDDRIIFPYKGRWIVQLFTDSQVSNQYEIEFTDAREEIFEIASVDKISPSQLLVNFRVFTNELNLDNVKIYYSDINDANYLEAVITERHHLPDDVWVIVDLPLTGWNIFYAEDVINTNSTAKIGVIL